MDMGPQLVNAPGSACNPNHRDVEVTVLDHRLQGREYLLIREIAGDAKDDECIRMAVRHDAPSPAFSRWPPNSKRIADNNLSAKSASPRELNRSKSAELSTYAGTDSSIAALMVQRPSPESDTRPEKSLSVGLLRSAAAVRARSHELMTLPRRQTSATSGCVKSQGK